jgi:riboflavin kinase/FMN adenylyltransferase
MSSRPVEVVFGGRPLPAHLRGAVVALGNFDGGHVGHQAVAARAVSLARSRGVAAIVGTFDPHPKRLFKPDATAFRLTSLEQRRHHLAEFGVDAMMVFEFTRALANVTPQEFVGDWLRDIGGVVTGGNFAFGRARSGDVGLLAALGAERAITVDTVAPVSMDGEIVSSSRIRAALQRGDCALTARLLRRPYTIAGELRPGVRMDPGLPLLDASVRLHDYLRPRRGVYAVRARLPKGRSLSGSAFLENASDEGADQLLELFLVDVRETDLGQPIQVELIAHLHDAHETYDTPELRERIKLDRDQARELVSGPIELPALC